MNTSLYLLISLWSAVYCQIWDQKIIIYPYLWEIAKFSAITADFGNYLHFLFALSNEFGFSYQYRRLDSFKTLSPWFHLTQFYGQSDSFLFSGVGSELIFFFQNNTQDGAGPLMFRASYNNGKAWDGFFPVDSAVVSRSGFAALRSVVSNYVWLYDTRFPSSCLVGYMTRPSGSTIYTPEKPALNSTYGRFSGGNQALITYDEASPIIHLFPVSDKGMFYAYSTDSGITYNFGSRLGPLPGASDVAANYKYSNETVFVAYDNQLRWTSDFGSNLRSVNVTNQEVTQVDLAICEKSNEWRVYYFATKSDGGLIFGYLSIKDSRFIQGKLPVETTEAQIPPQVFCYKEGSSTTGKTKVGIIVGDDVDGAKTYLADA